MEYLLYPWLVGNLILLWSFIAFDNKTYHSLFYLYMLTSVRNNTENIINYKYIDNKCSGASHIDDNWALTVHNMYSFQDFFLLAEMVHQESRD